MLKLKPRKTVEDFTRLPAGTLAELIGGEIFVTPSPTADHQRIVLRLAVVLHGHLTDGGKGEAFVAPIDVHLPSGDVVQPDIAVVLRSRAELVREVIQGAPDLVIEVLSAGRTERDRLVKKDLYARNGVTEYWIVDPASRTIEVHGLVAGTYEPSGYFEANDVLASRLLPGCEISLTTIFSAR